MSKAGDVLDLGSIGMKIVIRKTAAETEGQALEMEMEVAPQTGGTPLHVHPHAEEIYEVLQGKFDVNIDGVWKSYLAGEKALVKKNVAHTFRNTSDEPVRVHNIHQPAMKFEEYFTRLHKLANSGVVNSDKMTIKAMIHLSMLMASYPDEIRSVKPPYPVMRVFSMIGQLLGYRV